MVVGVTRDDIVQYEFRYPFRELIVFLSKKKHGCCFHDRGDATPYEKWNVLVQNT